MSSGDSIVFKFTYEFDNLQDGVQITVIGQAASLIYGSGATGIFDLVNVVVYASARLIVGYIPTGKSIAAADTNIKLQIKNLMSMSFSSITWYIEYYGVRSNKINYIFRTALGAIPVSAFTGSFIRMSSYSADDVAVHATFFTQTTSFFSKTGKFIQYMDNSWPLLTNSNPLPTCVMKRKGFVDQIYGTCTTYSNYVEITSIQEDIPSLYQIEIHIYGVRLTSTIGPTVVGTTGFRIEAKDSGGSKIMYGEYPSIDIIDAKPLGKVYLRITPDFYNCLFTTAYIFQISSNHDLHGYGQIQLKFPNEFIGNMPAQIQCSMWESVIYYNPCTYNSATNIVTLYINNDVLQHQKIWLRILDIKNPSGTATNKGITTTVFHAEAFYDGKLLDMSDDDDPNNKVQLIATPGKFTFASIDNDPTNSAERSTYTFTFKLTEKDLNTNQTDKFYIAVKFPSVYSSDLTPIYAYDPICRFESELITCIHGKEREIWVQFENTNLTKGTTYTINAYNVINPIKGTHCCLFLFILDSSGQNLLYLSDTSLTATVIDPPVLLNMSSIQVQDAYMNWPGTNYILKFQTEVKDIPLDSSFIIEWPQQYKNIFGKYSFRCKFINTTYQVTTLDECLVNPYYNVEMSIGKAKNATSASSLQLFTLQLYNIPTSQDEGETYNFIVKIYSNKQIIARSYGILTYPRTLFFSAYGENIYVSTRFSGNVQQGIFSEGVIMDLGASSAHLVNITFEPFEGTVIPEYMIFQYDWKSSNQFSIGVPYDLEPGEYRIVWRKYEEIEKDEFSPIQATIFTVVPQIPDSVAITVEDLPPVPLGGISVKLWIKLEYPSYSELTLTPYLSASNLDYIQNIKFVPEKIVFQQGETKKFFQINVTGISASGNLKFQKEGNSAISYYLHGKPVVTTKEKDTVPPQLRQMDVDFKQRQYARIRVQASEVITVYYMYSLEGTAQPTWDEIYNQIPVDADVDQVFGWNHTDSRTHVINFEIFNIRAGTNYIIYAIVEDMAGNKDPNVYSLEFTTMDKYRPAKFRVYTNKVVAVSDVKTALSKTMAVPEKYLLNLEIDYTRGSTLHVERLLFRDNELFYMFALYIPDDLNVNPPMYYVEQMSMSKLKERLPQLNENKDVYSTATEFVLPLPEFLETPSIIEVGINHLVVQAQLRTDGHVYGIALESDKVPLSQQIVEGYDFENKEVEQGRFLNDSSYFQEIITMNFTNLKSNTTYHVWLSGSNMNPGSPNIMPDYSVAHLTQKTEASQEDIIEATVKIIIVSKGEVIMMNLWFLMLILLNIV